METTEAPKLRVREWRKKRNMRQVDLAYRAHIQPSTVSHIETGETVPNVRLLATLAEALDVDIRDLFEEPKPPSPRSKPETVAKHLVALEDTATIASHARQWAGEDSARALKRLDALRDALQPHYEAYKAQGGGSPGQVWAPLLVTGEYMVMEGRMAKVAEQATA